MFLQRRVQCICEKYRLRSEPNLFALSHFSVCERTILPEHLWLVVLGFNATLTAKVIAWRSVTHMSFLAFSRQY